MASYVSVREFAQGWTFFAKRVLPGPDGKFRCSKFSCSGCDDWLDSDNQNRKVKNFSSQVYSISVPLVHSALIPDKFYMSFKIIFYCYS